MSPQLEVAHLAGMLYVNVRPDQRLQGTFLCNPESVLGMQLAPGDGGGEGEGPGA